MVLLLVNPFEIKGDIVITGRKQFLVICEWEWEPGCLPHLQGDHAEVVEHPDHLPLQLQVGDLPGLLLQLGDL